MSDHVSVKGATPGARNCLAGRTVSDPRPREAATSIGAAILLEFKILGHHTHIELAEALSLTFDGRPGFPLVRVLPSCRSSDAMKAGAPSGRPVRSPERMAA